MNTLKSHLHFSVDSSKDPLTPISFNQIHKFIEHLFIAQVRRLEKSKPYIPKTHNDIN